MGEEKYQSLEVITFRLDSISNEIKELKELLVSVPLLVSALDGLKAEHSEDIENLNKKIDVANENIEKHFQDILNTESKRLETKIETNEKALRLEARNRQDGYEKEVKDLREENAQLKKIISSLEERTLVLEKAPDKKSASKWNYIVENIFKTVVGIGIAYLIMRLGLKG